MTVIKIKRQQQGQQQSIIAVDCDGHTEYGVSGEDIVCAALSSIVQTALLGLMQVCGINVDYIKDDKKGRLVFNLPIQMEQRARHDADIVLDTMLVGLLDLHETYSDFVQVELQ